MELQNRKNLNTLISKSRRMPRAITSEMRASLRDNPTKALNWGVFRDDLVSSMIKAYRLGYREDGSRVTREVSDQALKEFNRKARGILMQYQKFGNRELKRAHAKAIKAGKTERQARDQVLRRFNTLGMTSPASARMEALFSMASEGAYAQGVWEASQNNQEIVGFKYKTQEDDRVRYPWHTQLNNMTAAKDDPVWEKYFPPWAYGCRCYAYPLKRVPKGGWTGLPSDFVVPPDDGFEKSSFELE